MRQLLIICSAAIALLGVGCVVNHPQDSGSSQVSFSIPNEAPRQIVINRYQIVPSSFSVLPGEYYSSQFHVSGSGRVIGTFRSDTNIIVAIVDQEGLRRIANRGEGEGGNIYYNTEKIGSGQIDVTLSSGTYYIVFLNTYSVISTKRITTNIILEN